MARRFTLYFIGVIISSMVIYFSTCRGSGNRYTLWTPNERIKEALRNDSILATMPDYACLIACQGVSKEEMDSLLVAAEAEIDGPAAERDTIFYTLKGMAVDGERLAANFQWIRSTERGRLIWVKKGDIEATPPSCDCP